MATLKVLNTTTGGLSGPSKMPCPSWSTSPEHCRVGSRLRKVPGSTCEGCYARGGCYQYSSTQAAMARRLAALQDLPAWTDAMVETLQRSHRRLKGFFRWHDSGDLQSMAHLEALVKIAQRMPEVKFWLPTREYGMVRDYLRRASFPENLTVRVSLPMRDQGPTGVHFGRAGWELPTSGVHEKREPFGFPCPVTEDPDRTGCNDCRACWDPAVKHVSYRYHR